jgi:hypothetical protein
MFPPTQHFPNHTNIPSVPPNYHFEIDDVEDEWVYNYTFDFIHGRALFTCFVSPLRVFRSAYAQLNPGGYFEMQDPFFKAHSIDSTLAGTSFESWNSWIVASAAKMGRDWHCTLKYKAWFEEAGFVDVVEKVFA